MLRGFDIVTIRLGTSLYYITAVVTKHAVQQENCNLNAKALNGPFSKKKAALASEAVKWLLDQVVFEVFHSACIDSAVAKGGQPRQHTTDEVRERKNVATRANRQAAKSTIIVNTPNTQRQERAGVQRARRRIEAI